MNLTKYVEITKAIVNTLAILGSILSVKVFFKWIVPKLKTKAAINRLLVKRGCMKCPRNESINNYNGGFCQWQNPAGFGRDDLKDCKCFKGERC